MNQLHEYWQAIHAQICPACVESDGHGHCSIHPAAECTLQVSLPAIVDIVTHTTTWNKTAKQELRAIICGECKHQTINGKCTLSEDTACPVEKYFPLIIETIRHVHTMRSLP